MKYLVYSLMTFTMTVAFAVTTGDMVELTEYLNGRSSASFAKSSANLIKVLPPGTKGKVHEVREFATSKNAGIHIEVTEGPNAGKKFWIYLNRTVTPPRLKFATAAGTPTVEPTEAATATTTTEVPAVVDPGLSLQTIADAPPVRAQVPAGDTVALPDAPAPAPEAVEQPAAGLASPTSGRDTPEILFIGDSHSVGCFGDSVDEGLRDLRNPPGSPTGPRVTTVATCGSSTPAWLGVARNVSECKGMNTRRCTAPSGGSCSVFASTADSGSMEANFTPSFKAATRKTVVIALGTNMLPSPVQVAIGDAEALIEKLKAAGSGCVWIGPPQAKANYVSVQIYDAWNRRFKAFVESKGCHFVDSSAATNRANINDPLGVHYTCDQSRAWASRVRSDLLGAVQRQLTPLPAAGDRPATQPARRSR